MGPVWQNPIERTVRTAHQVCLWLCAQLQYTTQHRTILIISLLLWYKVYRLWLDKRRWYCHITWRVCDSGASRIHDVGVCSWRTYSSLRCSDAPRFRWCSTAFASTRRTPMRDNCSLTRWTSSKSHSVSSVTVLKTYITELYISIQWLKCHWSQGNAISTLWLKMFPQVKFHKHL